MPIEFNTTKFYTQTHAAPKKWGGNHSVSFKGTTAEMDGALLDMMFYIKAFSGKKVEFKKAEPFEELSPEIQQEYASVSPAATKQAITKADKLYSYAKDSIKAGDELHRKFKNAKDGVYDGYLISNNIAPNGEVWQTIIELGEKKDTFQKRYEIRDGKCRFMLESADKKDIPLTFHAGKKVNLEAMKEKTHTVHIATSYGSSNQVYRYGELPVIGLDSVSHDGVNKSALAVGERPVKTFADFFNRGSNCIIFDNRKARATGGVQNYDRIIKKNKANIFLAEKAGDKRVANVIEMQNNKKRGFLQPFDLKGTTPVGSKIEYTL